MNAFRTALVAIIEGDGPQGSAGTLQNLCGRGSNLVVAWDDLKDAVLPIGTYLLVDVSQGAGSGDQRRVLAQLDTWADEASGGIDKAEQIADRYEAILTEPNFRAQNVDAAPWLVRRRDNVESQDDVAAGRRRVTLEMTFTLKRS